jgi:magnesium-transporting ATPase (P-type)
MTDEVYDYKVSWFCFLKNKFESKMERVGGSSSSSEDSPFKPVSFRISIFLIVFIVSIFIISLMYGGQIALYWLINGSTFQWIVVVDIFAAVILIVTGILGIVSLVTYVIPLIRFIAASLVF